MIEEILKGEWAGLILFGIIMLGFLIVWEGINAIASMHGHT